MNIDTSKIDGYAEMSAEDKIKALETFNIDVSPANGDVEKLKQALSNANSEAANYKKQLREKQSADEREAAERLERDKQRDEELESYRRKDKVSDAEKHYLAMGYDPVLAQATAEAEVDGNVDVVRANQKAHQEAYRKAIEAELLNKQPGITGGNAPVGPDPDKMTDAEFYATYYSH